MTERMQAPGDSRLALVCLDLSENGGEILANWVRQLRRAGRRVAGVVQSYQPRLNRRACDMYLENLATGEELCISADRGPGARGCRLDLSALAQATLWIERALAAKPELLALNKFGKEEALGRGSFPAMAEALACDIPVIAGVSVRNLDAALALTEGVCTLIEPTEAAANGWLLGAARARGAPNRDR